MYIDKLSDKFNFLYEKIICNNDIYVLSYIGVRNKMT